MVAYVIAVVPIVWVSRSIIIYRIVLSNFIFFSFRNKLILILTTAADIMATNNPAVAKRLSYNIKNFKQDAWNTKRHDIMLQLVKAKFKQNSKLADELRATGKKTISESSRHKYFANGLAITNKEILNTLK